MVKTGIKSGMFFALVMSLMLGAHNVLAQAKCMVNGNEVPCEELEKQIKGSLGWGIVGFIVFGILGVWAMVFWVMMLVHAAKHNIENKPMWIIVMVFTGIVGALAYYFVVKRKFVEQLPSPPSTPPMPMSTPTVTP